MSKLELMELIVGIGLSAILLVEHAAETTRRIIEAIVAHMLLGQGLR